MIFDLFNVLCLSSIRHVSKFSCVLSKIYMHVQSFPLFAVFWCVFFVVDFLLCQINPLLCAEKYQDLIIFYVFLVFFCFQAMYLVPIIGSDEGPLGFRVNIGFFRIPLRCDASQSILVLPFLVFWAYFGYISGHYCSFLEDNLVAFFLVLYACATDQEGWRPHRLDASFPDHDNVVRRQ